MESNAATDERLAQTLQALCDLVRQAETERAKYPPIVRPVPAAQPLYWLYSIGLDRQGRQRLRDAACSIPRKKFISDDADELGTSLGKRPQWLRLARSFRSGDVVVFTDCLALGPVWRDYDATFSLLNQTASKARIGVVVMLKPAVDVLPTDPPVAVLNVETPATVIDEIRAEAAAEFHLRQLREGLRQAKREGRRLGRPPTCG